MNKIMVGLFLTCLSCNEVRAEENKMDGGMERKESLANAMIKNNIETSKDKVCSDDMVEVDTMYCPKVKFSCNTYVNLDGKATSDSIPQSGQSGRCGEWSYPTECLSSKIHLHFCIDRYEYPNKKDTVPEYWMSWYDAKKACEGVGKRLLMDYEWSAAAQDNEMKPYPYGDGYHRDKTICNFDHHTTINGKAIDVFQAKQKDDEVSLLLKSLLVPSGSMENCHNNFGIYDLVGNIDEWVVNSSNQPYTSGLMSGHIFGIRNSSFFETKAHFPGFTWYETGTRCGKDIESTVHYKLYIPG